MSHKKKLLPLVIAFVVTMLSLAVPAPASAATLECDVPAAVTCQVSHPDGIKRVTVIADDRDDDRRPDDLKGDDGDRLEGVSPYTEYCLKKYPFDPEKAYECSLGWVVD